MTGPTTDPDAAFAELPPSCKFVYRELASAEADRLTRQQLLDRTGLPESTLDDALRTLESRHWVVRARRSETPQRSTAEIRDSRRV